jgi:hypothetical protein
MILFARSQRHARRRAQGIIGVSPVFPIPAKEDGARADCRIGFQPVFSWYTRTVSACSFRGRHTGRVTRLPAGNRLEAYFTLVSILSSDILGSAWRHQARSIIGVSPVFPIPADC